LVTHPPRNAPIGLRIGKAEEGISRRRLDVLNVRLDCRMTGAVAVLDRRRAGLRNLEAMGFEVGFEVLLL
jgi:hypothetical protein